jgi:ssDNA-binding replication factor A large subunit|tara:strand:- start:2229 stop:3227 length:999 start_codon:yes stop_codon:yes gene_type:complete
MISLNYEEIIKKITEQKEISRQELEDKITSKVQQLNELVTKEGAAHIIANDLGVKLFDYTKKRYKVNELIAGQNFIEIVAKVVEKYDVREFVKNNREGKVQNILVGDETGAVRLVLWDNSQIDLMNKVKEKDILLVSGGYIKKNNGFKEFHLNKSSVIEINPKNESVGEVIIKMSKDVESKKIKDLEQGENVSITGTIVQIFEPRFYNACPQCNRKVVLEGDKSKCLEHGFVTENVVPILNLYLDDGTESIRVVAFRDLACGVLSLKSEDMKDLKENASKFIEVRDQVLGNQIIVDGVVKKNEMFDRLEFVANSIKEVNVDELVDSISKELK